MALLPWTQDFRQVPVMTDEGLRLQNRRKIRGVGAAERALGAAWSRLSSWDRERIGSQKNYASLMQQRANRVEQQRLQQQAEAEREKGRQSVLPNPGPSVLPNSTGTGASERSADTSSGRDALRRVRDPIPQSGIPTTPAPNPNRLVEHMGRQYPASLVNNPTARNQYDTDIETRHRQAMKLENMDCYVKNEVRQEMNPQGDLSPQEKLARAVNEGRVTDYDVNAEELQKRRRQRFGRPDPQMPEYTPDGQVVRDWRTA